MESTVRRPVGHERAAFVVTPNCLSVWMWMRLDTARFQCYTRPFALRNEQELSIIEGCVLKVHGSKRLKFLVSLKSKPPSWLQNDRWSLKCWGSWAESPQKPGYTKSIWKCICCWRLIFRHATSVVKVTCNLHSTAPSGFSSVQVSVAALHWPDVHVSLARP